MPEIIALEDVRSTREQREVKGGSIWTTRFLMPPKGTRLPQFFMVENTPRRLLRTHFHDVDQFQFIVDGDGTLGRHAVRPFTVHFARAHTPYGPIVTGDDGLTWLTVRARRDAEGAQFLPEKREQLEQVQQRNPWQYSEDPVFETSDAAVTVRACSILRDDRGLAVHAIRMKPHARTVAPGPADTAGQYVVAVRGSLVDDGRERQAIATCYLEPGDSPLELVAGAAGLDAIVLDFPRLDGMADKNVASTSGAFKTWRCVLCGFVYDEAAGMPDEGVAPGTRWDAVPESWSCPDCFAAKQDFDMVEV